VKSGARENLSRSDTLASLEQLIRSSPDTVDAYHRLAAVYLAHGELRRAELTLRRAIEIEPLNPKSWRLQGTLAGRAGKWTDSATAFQSAVRCNEKDLSIGLSYAESLIRAQKLSGAEQAVQRILEVAPKASGAHLLVGHIAKIRGLTHRAVSSYRRALELDPECVEAIFNLTEIAVPSPSDPLTEQLVRLRDDSRLPDEQMINVHFALGRIYEAAHRVADAFAAYQAANTLTGACAQGTLDEYDRKPHERLVTELRETFPTSAAIAGLEPLGIQSRLIFIVGLPRSGTTLVERILGSHSRVCSGGELPFMHHCLTSLLSWRRESGDDGALDTGSAASRSFLRQLREYYIDRIFEYGLDADYVIDKLPANFQSVGLIRLLFPTALIVHCLRDPLATCWSLYRSNFGAHLSYYTRFDHLAHYHRRIYTPVMSHWQTLLGGGITEVKYENLVTRFAEEAARVVTGCELEWEGGCAEFYRNANPVYTASMVQCRSPIYHTALERWRPFEPYLRPLIQELTRFN